MSLRQLERSFQETGPCLPRLSHTTSHSASSAIYQITLNCFASRFQLLPSQGSFYFSEHLLSVLDFSRSLLTCHLPYKVLIDMPGKIRRLILCSQDTCSSCYQHCLPGGLMLRLWICPHCWTGSSSGAGPRGSILFLALSNAQNNV